MVHHEGISNGKEVTSGYLIAYGACFGLTLLAAMGLPPLAERVPRPLLAGLGDAAERAAAEPEVHRGLPVRIGAGPAADVMGGFGQRANMIDKALAEIEAEGAGVLVILRDLVPGFERAIHSRELPAARERLGAVASERLCARLEAAR